MKQFQILTDSTSDLTKELRDEYEIDYVKMAFNQCDKEHYADLDWTDITPEEYYQNMRKGNRSTTNLVLTSEFEKKFKEYLDKGLDVMYISCSSKLSGSLNNGKIVADEILASYPGRKIVCVDSLRSNLAQGLICVEASKLERQGLDILEVQKIIEAKRLEFQTYATVATLDWLKKAGRVKATAAFFGNLMGVKPIIVGDKNGNNYAFKKVKGRNQSLDELVNILKTQKNEKTTAVYVEHADSLDAAKLVANKIKTEAGISNVTISNLGPIIGATTGPDTITINFQGKKVDIAGE